MVRGNNSAKASPLTLKCFEVTIAQKPNFENSPIKYELDHLRAIMGRNLTRLFSVCSHGARQLSWYDSVDRSDLSTSFFFVTTIKETKNVA